jgi:hypothetical protein
MEPLEFKKLISLLAATFSAAAVFWVLCAVAAEKEQRFTVANTRNSCGEHE